VRTANPSHDARERRNLISAGEMDVRHGTQVEQPTPGDLAALEAERRAARPADLRPDRWFRRRYHLARARAARGRRLSRTRAVAFLDCSGRRTMRQSSSSYTAVFETCTLSWNGWARMFTTAGSKSASSSLANSSRLS